MLPRHHIIFGLLFIFIFNILYLNISSVELAIIFLSSVLIDVDHILYYFFKTRRLNPFKAYSWYIANLNHSHQIPKFKRRNIYSGFFLFHGIEWLIILFFLSSYFSFCKFILIGMAFHLTLDLVHEIYDKRTMDKISIFWSYLKFRKENKSNSLAT